MAFFPVAVQAPVEVVPTTMGLCIIPALRSTSLNSEPTFMRSVHKPSAEIAHVLCRSLCYYCCSTGPPPTWDRGCQSSTKKTSVISNYDLRKFTAHRVDDFYQSYNYQRPAAQLAKSECCEMEIHVISKTPRVKWSNFYEFQIHDLDPAPLFLKSRTTILLPIIFWGGRAGD